MSGDRLSRRRVLRWTATVCASTILPATTVGAVAGDAPESPASDHARAGRSSPTQAAKLVPDDGDPGDQFGDAVAVDGDTALVGAQFDDDPNGEEAGAAYVFEGVDGEWTQRAKLVADDGAGFDRFGHEVALDGDTALVGANGHDGLDASFGGAVYAFERVDGEWTQRAKLVAEDSDARDNFGTAVALAGDTALVGAENDAEPNGDDAGAAYVFERAGGEWAQAAKLAPGDGDTGDRFGNAVALADGTALVGAWTDEDPNGDRAGSAYVFERTGEGWTQRSKLAPDGGDGNDFFGNDVALDGDTALVGAPGAAGPDEPLVGAAHVYDRAGGEWRHRANLAEVADLDREDAFGTGIDLAGDTALVGAWRDDDPHGEDGGAAYVFERVNGEWTRGTMLAAGDGDPDDRFGVAGTLAGDTALLGARRDEDPHGEAAGSAYVFSGVGLSPVERADEDGNERISTEELRAAIRGWARGEYTTDGLRAVVRAWAAS